MSIYLNADCMNPETGLPSYPDNHFDLAIVDPPYGIGNFVQITGNVRGSAVSWNNTIPSMDYFGELLRVSKEQIIWGANYYNCFSLRGGAIIWNKHVPRESNLSVCQIASYSRLKRVDYIDLPWQNIHRPKLDTIHPCQKPIALYRWLLKNYAKQGDLILDTHVGSASSLVAFEEMGFEYVGYELDADYYRDSCKRLEAFRAQPKLFTGSEIFRATQGEQGTLFEL